MLTVTRIGENSLHDSTFQVDRPNGYPHYLLLLVKTPALFYCEDSWQSVGPGTAFLFQPGQAHLYHAIKDSYVDSWIHLHSDAPLLDSYFPFGRPITLHEPERFDQLFHMIYSEFFHASAKHDVILHDLTSALLNMLSDESCTYNYPDLYYSLVALREQIYLTPSSDWNIPDLAHSLAISEGYFHTSYQHFFHTTCMADVIHARIQMSIELLLSTKRPVAEIGELCGYHNTEHFIRQFKKQTGQTPGQFRKQQ